MEEPLHQRHPSCATLNADGKTRIKEVYKSITRESDEHVSILASLGYGCGAGFVKHFSYDSSAI